MANWWDKSMDWTGSNIPVAGPFVSGLFGRPSRPYDDAASGMRNVSDQFRGLGDEQWRRQMEGMNTALGQYQPAWGAWSQAYGNRGPGAMESWWSQNQGQFGQPTASGSAYQQYSDWMRGGDQKAQGAYDQASGMLGQSQAGDVYGQFSGALGGRRSDAENWYARMGSQYGQPSQSEGVNTYLQDTFRNMSNKANQRNQEQYEALKAAGRTEQYAPEKVTLAQSMAMALPQMQGTARLDAEAGDIKNYYRGAGQASDYYRSQQGALQGPGAYEQFVTSDIMGNNPAFAMEREEGLAALNQEMARRGAFNSGAAMTGVGKFLGTLGAKSYENRAQRAQQAQGMQLSRIGQGTQSAQAAAQGQLAQGQAFQGLAGARDSEKRARIDQQQRAVDSASSESMSNQRLGLDAARAADETRLARERLRSDVSSSGDASLLNILRGMQGAAGQADDALLARLAGGQSSAGASDAGLLNRLGALYGMGQGVDRNALDRAGAMWGMGQGYDRLGMDRYGQLGQMAGQFDQATLARLMGGGAMAGAAQDAESARLRDYFNSIYGLSGAQAGLVAGMYGGGNQLYGDQMTNALNALANAYGTRAMGGAAAQEYPFKIIGAATEGYKAYKTGGMR